DRRIRDVRIEMAGVEREYAPPRLQLRRRDVVPMRAAVVRHPDQAIVGAGPDEISIQGRRRERVHDAAVGRLGFLAVRVFADAGRHLPGLARQVGTDLLPVLPAVVALPYGVRGEIQAMRIGRRKLDRHRAHGAVIRIARGYRPDVGDLPGVAVVARDTAAGTAVNEVRVQRIDRGAAVFLDTGRMPVVRGQLTIVAARRHAGRA